MIKIKKLFLVLILAFSCLALVGCKEEDVKTLRIYNWQDYIDDGTEGGSDVIDDFKNWYQEKYGEELVVVYDTFETNEVMLNNLKTGKTTYDLICPSEYTIQKMIRLDMLDKYDFNLKDKNGEKILENYQNVSPYLIDLFTKNGWNDYAVPYMWGTLGFIYNPEKVSEDDIIHWDILWNKEYNNMASAKDSVRDTYVVGVMYVYYDELMALHEKYYNNGEISFEEYNKQVKDIMNRCDDETLKKVKEALIEMKDNLYGFEVDSGKSDIVTGKIDINFAWSGDAVYAMDLAEKEDPENPLYLNYYVPDEGSNIWFDGWVMPKGANKELAEMFVNYVCSTEVAVQNMNFIGYTSSIVGDEILDMIDDWYGATLPEFDSEIGSWVYGYESEDDGTTICVLDISDETLAVSIDEDGNILLGDDLVFDLLEGKTDSNGSSYQDMYACTYYEVDLTYLFEDAVSDEYLDDEGKVIVAVEERGRQFDAQYPNEEIIARCGIMEDFGDANDNVLAMWENVKIGSIPLYITITLVSGVVILIVILYISKYRKIKLRNKRKNQIA